MASKDEPTLGFYTVQHDDVAGWMGGYLLLNTSGRPLEFHCSLPFVPTRTQEILYGPSLRPYLVGELIGQSVIARSKLRASAIVTDTEDALQLATVVNIPFVSLEFSTKPDIENLVDIDGRQGITSSGHQARIVEFLGNLPKSLDLSEPFERIREAFGEARGTSRAAA